MSSWVGFRLSRAIVFTLDWSSGLLGIVVWVVRCSDGV
jgi:hypothetical protein